MSSLVNGGASYAVDALVQGFGYTQRWEWDCPLARPAGSDPCHGLLLAVDHSFVCSAGLHSSIICR
jgi:hypothetical protein